MAEYVNNAKFLEYLIEYRETKSKKSYNEIGKVFLLIATNLLNKWNFTSYTLDRKQDMIGLAVYYMTKYMKNFNEKKGPPFAYFTQFAGNAFKQYIIERKRYDAVFKTTQFMENMSEVSDDDVMEMQR